MKITDEQLAETEVKDDFGQPLVVYHGTPANFDTFSDVYLQSLGFHFGDSIQANHFAGTAPGAHVIPVFLLIYNLIDIRPSDSGWLRPKLTAICLHLDGWLSFGQTCTIIGSDNLSLADHGELEAQATRQERNGEIIAALEAQDCDGILYTNKQEPPDGIDRDAYLVFHAHQIYSAITRDRLSDDA